ncbi:MAG: AAA family ATPase [Solirubrobacterales bacterium]|nr:AAA family ATPase [Solirubrobacterales bacterium]
MTASAGRRPESTSLFVLVAGPPGSGKSTLAAPMARELSLPLLSKDAIKDALIDVLGVAATVEDSRELGRASVMAMLTVARTSPGAVLDSTFYPYTLPHLRALPGQLIEIRCVCPRRVVEARYRARSGSRARGYFDSERPAEELWNEHHLTPTGLGPLIEVDTSDQVDVAAIAARVRSAVARGR